MGRLSDTQANVALDAAIASTVYVELSTTLPTNTGGNVTPPSGGAYARASATMGAAASRSKSNSATVTFPTPTASWGSPTHFALYSASTSGTFLGWGALGSTQAIASGATVTFASGALTVTMGA